MKKFLAVLVVFGLGVCVGTLLQQKAPVAQAGQEPACAPLLVNPTRSAPGVVIQDMNGDGVYDPIAEAIRLLQWHFLGGPAPVRPCPWPLPPTGQTRCYNMAGREILCDSATCPGQDGAYAPGCPSEGRFTDNGDGTVTDTCTGLMWQQDTADVNGDGRGDFLPWCEALAYCESLNFAGHGDWRLPNVRELQSIVDYGRFDPSINPVFGAFLGRYWSSTSYAGSPAVAWHVSFDDGVVAAPLGLAVSTYVRAVRSGP